MTFGSLFAGIGGLDLGLERAGLECVWQVEIDNYARRVLAKHWPRVRRHDDVKTFPPPCYSCSQRYTRVGHEPGVCDGCGCVNNWKCDLICGGFPCQDISIAGKGSGIEGPRSGLWKEYLRIVRVLRPSFVLVENVPALLGRGMGVVLKDLAQSGYDCWWDSIQAAAFGAHFLGERVFIIASAAKASSLRRQREWKNSIREVSPYSEKSKFERLVQLSLQLCVPSRSPGRVHDGVPSRVDRLRGLGNAVVPQVAQWIGERIMSHENAENP